ncbi:MAG: hypothetical protein HY903_18330 [Deltaproteobacteria bacterium]|nr:hypothetical protein [Deltaproteobacteria bacterium]
MPISSPLSGTSSDPAHPSSCGPHGDSICTGARAKKSCLDDGVSWHWVDETCPAGSGCVNGECRVGECSDECRLGQTNGSGQSCGLLDLASGNFIPSTPATSVADRARAYEKLIHSKAMLGGAVGSPYFSDPPTYQTVTRLGDVYDSALWTGTYLAAQALRLKATGSPGARTRVRGLVRTLNLLCNVAGQPGLLSRFALKSADVATAPLAANDKDCTREHIHCDVPYGDTTYMVLGHISRDMYQGVMLGYALAYEALGDDDEELRELIRQDVVELAEQLMFERDLPVDLTVNGVELPRMTVKMRFAVAAPWEFRGGAAYMAVDTSAQEGEMWGFQEFIPDLYDIIDQAKAQLPDFLASLLPTAPIPRPGSAIMLAAAFQVALLVTRDQPAWADKRNAILDFYLHNTGRGGNIDNWLDIADLWQSNSDCGEAYYANNIMMEPLYNLARLDTDPGRSARVLGLFKNTIWPKFEKTKNAFFSFIYAGTVPGVPATVATGAATQVSQFPVPPLYRRPVDLRADARFMPHANGCTDQANHDTAIDVGERPVRTFLWQHHPWTLYDPGDAADAQPGVDFLVAYWMGRYHGFINDDRAGKCLAWH